MLTPACPANVWGSVPISCPRPDGTISERRRDNTQRRRGQKNERGGAGARREGRHGHMQKERGKRTDRVETNPHPLKKQRPEMKSNRKGATRQRNRRMEKGRRGTIRGTIRPRRITVYGRSTETGSTPILAHTSTEESATMRHGKRGGVTSRSCHRGDMTCRAGRS